MPKLAEQAVRYSGLDTTKRYKVWWKVEQNGVPVYFASSNARSPRSDGTFTEWIDTDRDGRYEVYLLPAELPAYSEDGLIETVWLIGAEA